MARAPKLNRLGSGALDDAQGGAAKVELRIRFWTAVRQICPELFEDLRKNAWRIARFAPELRSFQERWRLPAKDTDSFWMLYDIANFVRQPVARSTWPDFDALRPPYLRRARRLNELQERYERDQRVRYSRTWRKRIARARTSPNSPISKKLLAIADRPDIRRAIARLGLRGVEHDEHCRLELLLFSDEMAPAAWKGPWQFPRLPDDSQVLAPIEAVPTFEDRDSFLERAAKHWQARTAAAKRLGFSTSRVKSTEHLEMLVWYQFKGHDWESIAKNLGKPGYPSTNLGDLGVKDAVRRAARVLGLSLRTRRRGPRPKAVATAIDGSNELD